jgi:hypothetical protein
MFEISLTGPPNREELVAEIELRGPSSIDQPAEIFKSGGRIMLALYPRADGEPWEFPLAEFLEAIGGATARLGY